jgi:hypothetical protein
MNFAPLRHGGFNDRNSALQSRFFCQVDDVVRLVMTNNPAIAFGGESDRELFQWTDPCKAE